MFWTITGILLMLWALGMAAGSTVGAWVHLFLVFALVSSIGAVVRQGKRVVT